MHLPYVVFGVVPAIYENMFVVTDIYKYRLNQESWNRLNAIIVCAHPLYGSIPTLNDGIYQIHHFFCQYTIIT